MTGVLIGRAHPLAPIGDPLLFRCGHPRTSANSTRGYLHKSGRRYPQCRLCHRTRWIARTVDRQLAAWKAGKPTHDEMIRRRCL